VQVTQPYVTKPANRFGPGNFRPLWATTAVQSLTSPELKPAMQKVRTIFAGLIGILLAGCGAGGASSGGTSSSEPASPILQAWAAFPVNALPRPIVLVGSPVLDPAGGFLAVSSKEAYVSGFFNRPDHLPNGPSTSDGYPVISADAAFALLQAASNSGTAPPPSGSRLTVTAAHLGAGTFLTDRGDRTMPAWLFSLAGVENPVTVLAVAPSVTWSPQGRATPGPYASFSNGAIGFDGADIAKDHRTLTVGFTGAAAGAGPCTASYALRVTESATAVAVKVISYPHGSGTEVCSLIGYPRHASAALGAPLGNRVVVDSISGGAVAVTGSP
jgi:hypothetical protein